MHKTRHRSTARHVTQPILLHALTTRIALFPAVIIILVILIPIAMTLLVISPLQQSTAPWPVTVGNSQNMPYQSAGWSVGSSFGWRENQQSGTLEFHDGIDLFNPSGGCPFDYRCPFPSIFDGIVKYVGWDTTGAVDPSIASGGQIVIIENGQADHIVYYKHLEPYRMYVQLQGRIRDEYGRYDKYADYQPIGQGELQPDQTGTIQMTCINDMPGFVATRTGPGTVTFVYDRPASCTTTVAWGQRGGLWQGWIPDEPSGSGGSAEIAWQTPVTPGERAGDIALRFRAHLVPPPPPPSPTPTPTSVVELPDPAPVFYYTITQFSRTDTSGSPKHCERSGAEHHCTWVLSEIPVLPLPEAKSMASATPTPAMSSIELAINASQVFVPINGLTTFSIVPYTNSTTSETISITVNVHSSLEILDISASNGSCLIEGQTIRCQVSVSQSTGTHMRLVARVRPEAQPGAWIDVTAVAAYGESSASAYQSIEVAPYEITPAPWPPPTLRPTIPTATPWPTMIVATPVPTPVDNGGGGPILPGECPVLMLEQLPGVLNSHGQPGMMRLVGPAAASFNAIRAEILAQTGVDALAVLADALRDPEFTTGKVGVSRTSWHKAGRAIDLNTAGPFRRVAEGRMYRLYLGTVDITAIFERHGWNRIPAQADVLEWWHYEYHPDGIAWTSAMLQIWPISRLQAAFPEIGWAATGCQVLEPPIFQISSGACVLELPEYNALIEELDGCGPPVRPGDPVMQLQGALGFVGLTGQTSGPHLHLGLKVKGYDGAYHTSYICGPAWMAGRQPPEGAYCWTDMADPLAFLPFAPAPVESGPAATIIPEGAPFQLPPPGYPDSLVLTPAPEDAPVGQYWSPYAQEGQYGGGGAIDWLQDNSCRAWSGFPWCS